MTRLMRSKLTQISFILVLTAVAIAVYWMVNRAPISEPLEQPAMATTAGGGDVTWEKGHPSTTIAFPRGENERRRYASPQNRKLSSDLLSKPPAKLAKLPADGRTVLLADEIDLHTKESKRLVFDPVAFDQVFNGTTARVLAPTTDDQVIDLHFDSVKTRSPHTYTIQGTIGGDPMSQVQFVFHDGVIHGNVTHAAKGLHYEYRTLQDGHLVVRTLDHASMTERCGKPNACSSECKHAEHQAEQLQHELAEQGVDIQIPSTEAGSVENDTTGWTTVDVVVGYGREARIADGGVSQIEARILDAVDRMNLAFVNSGITNTEMMILGTIEDPDYVFPGGTAGTMSSGDELGDLENSTDGTLDAVSDYATQLGADFRAFIVKQADGSAGVAYRPGRSSITGRDYLTPTRFTFAHELGHNLGCDHSWGDSNQGYKGDYGWRLDPDGNSGTTNDRVRTIMAYDWGWGQGWRVGHYANSAVLYGSAPTGTILKYNATGDPYADQRYIIGGLGYTGSNTSLSGFDGTNAALGARNYLTILNGQGNTSYGAPRASNRATRAAFSVPSPSAGAIYNPSETVDIFFIGGDHEYSATIDLYKGASLDTTIATNVNPATGRNLNWVVPIDQAAGNDYFIRVTLSHPSHSDVYADSGVFTIAAVEMLVASPNGGENWFKGITYPITWGSGLGGTVKIDLLKAGSLNTTIAASTTNDGSYDWTVPGGLTAAGDYTVRITSVDQPSKSDTSNANFSISVAPTAVGIPYYESFESGVGVWTQETTDSFDWTVLSGSTPSSSTGPSAAQNGSNYIYTEASTPRTTGETAVLTCWFDLRSTTAPELSFYYHMYGQANYGMGTLNFSASTGGDYETVWSKSGDQGNAWSLATVDLTPYSGQLVQLKITGTMGTSWDGDMAIDNMSILETATGPEMGVARGGGIADGGTDTVNGAVPGVGTQLTYIISNTGGSALTLTTPVTTNAVSNCSVAVGTQPSGSVAAASSTSLILTVTPSAGGNWSATVSITNNDSNESPYNWTISGTATAPIIDAALPSGISLYGYTGANPIDAQTAFQTLIDNSQLALVRWVNPTNGNIKELYYTNFPSAGWVNEIGDLTLGSGYVIKTVATCTLSITGNKSTASLSHNLPSGYSIIGFNQETPLDAQTAFQPLIDAGKLDLVRWVNPSNGQIKELYYTTFPSSGWVNEIGNLTEAQGYIIKLNAPHSGFTLP